VVVESSVLLAEALGIALGGVCDTHPVTVRGGSTTVSTISEVLRGSPDVVLVDSDLGPYVDSAALVDDLARCGLWVLVLTNRIGGDARRGEFLRRGAVGAISKEDGLAPVRTALERAIARQPVMDPRQARRLVAVAHRTNAAALAERERLASLTVREHEVLEMLMAGRTATQIARAGSVSELTVRSQIRSILSKLHVSSQVAAVATAYRCGWTPGAEVSGVVRVAPVRD
jgi:two-component system nitrate/nitrite response regulator NarL